MEVGLLTYIVDLALEVELRVQDYSKVTHLVHRRDSNFPDDEFER